MSPKGKDARCEEHRKAAGRARAKNRPELRYYGTAKHKAWRAAVLRRDPVCVICKAVPSTHADHYPRSLTDLLEIGLPLDDMDNGRGLCHSCHSRETGRLQPGGWNA